VVLLAVRRLLAAALVQLGGGGGSGPGFALPAWDTLLIAALACTLTAVLRRLGARRRGQSLQSAAPPVPPDVDGEGAAGAAELASGSQTGSPELLGAGSGGAEQGASGVGGGLGGGWQQRSRQEGPGMGLRERLGRSGDGSRGSQRDGEPAGL
jgi:hypothetical protein